jgi:hypothetical protein
MSPTVSQSSVYMLQVAPLRNVTARSFVPRSSVHMGRMSMRLKSAITSP